MCRRGPCRPTSWKVSSLSNAPFELHSLKTLPEIWAAEADAADNVRPNTNTDPRLHSKTTTHARPGAELTAL
jgi:hypothetical protein